MNVRLNIAPFSYIYCTFIRLHEKAILFATRVDADGIYLFKINKGNTRTIKESVQSSQ